MVLAIATHTDPRIWHELDDRMIQTALNILFGTDDDEGEDNG
jgi:hypothetical protein